MEVKFTCKSDDVVHSFGILDECQCGNHPKKQKQICFKERPRWQLKTFFTNQSKLCIEEFYNGNWQSFTYLILRRSVRKGHFSALILQNFVSMCWVRGEPDACPQFCTWEKISQTTSCNFFFFFFKWYLSSTNFKYNVNFSTRVNK